MKRKSGFTLIELLVVIAIIAILAGMIFPVFSRAREAARKAVCLSNIKQMGLAYQMYLEDWDRMTGFAYIVGSPPKPAGALDSPFGTWFIMWWQILMSYTGSKDVMVCPSAGNTFFGGYPPPVLWGGNVYGNVYSFWYGINQTLVINFAGTPAVEGIYFGTEAWNGAAATTYFIDKLDRQSEIILYADSIHEFAAPWFASYGGAAWTTQKASPDSNVAQFPRDTNDFMYLSSRAIHRHNGAANAVFLDGHAKSMKETKLRNWRTDNTLSTTLGP